MVKDLFLTFSCVQTGQLICDKNTIFLSQLMILLFFNIFFLHKAYHNVMIAVQDYFHLILYLIQLQFSSMFQKTEKELLRQQFELVAPNLKMIIQKKVDHMNYYERELLINILKKVIFIKESFDLKSPTFSKLAMNLQLEKHQVNQVVFKKGDKGEYFYIVLEGVYYVETENQKDKRKQKSIYYYPGDSFGQVSLIYDVPRGATIVANKQSSLIRIQKTVFNQCGNLEKSIKYLNTFFENHPYFQKQDKFMIRVVSSLSKLIKFGQKQVLIEEGYPFAQILFFVKGEANIYKRLKLQNKHGAWQQVVLMGKLCEGDVFGEKYYMEKEVSGVKIVSIHRGEFIKVSFRDNISTIETPLYKRIRQNAARFPTDEELLEQYKQFLIQKCKQLQFLQKVYKNDENVNEELRHAKNRYLKVKDSRLSK